VSAPHKSHTRAPSHPSAARACSDFPVERENLLLWKLTRAIDFPLHFVACVLTVILLLLFRTVSWASDLVMRAWWMLVAVFTTINRTPANPETSVRPPLTEIQARFHQRVCDTGPVPDALSKLIDDEDLHK
jgi:hypothetical protein